MARISNAQRLADIHAEALKEFDEIFGAVRYEREQCQADRRFYSIAGAQWEGAIGEQFENRPKMEVNKIALAVTRIFSEYRNNRVTVDFVSKEGNEYDKLADTCDGLYRADETDSGAEEAYDNAFEEAVGGGFGAWRLRTVYEDEEDDEDERQRIKFEPIFDADSTVYFDLGAKRQDKADAKRCFVLTSMTLDAYRDTYGEDPASWPVSLQKYNFKWNTPEVVYVADYYRIEERTETVRVFQHLDGSEERIADQELQDDPEMESNLLAIGAKEVRQKKVKRKKCRHMILSGGKVLEDNGLIPGNSIPVIPVYGKRWFVDNMERCMGHVRLAKDAQRLKNMQLSKLAEISALSSVEKPILLPEQIAGHQQMWAEDNLRNYPYLLVNPITDANGQVQPAGPVAYTHSAAVPPAMAALLQVTETDMSDLLGNQQAGEQVVSNISGKAVEMIQQRLDMQTFIYMSNMSKAIRRCGEVWLGMARDVYVEEGRKMKSLGGQGEISTVELAKPVIGENGEVEVENDLSDAKYDVAVDVGPSSSTKRSATVRALTGMMTITQDPETMQVLGAMAMMNMEGEGISEVRDFFRKRLIRMGVVKPTEEEAQTLMAEMQQAQQNQDPQALYLQAAAEEAAAKAAKARADTVLTINNAEKAKADAEQTQVETQQMLMGGGGGGQAQGPVVDTRSELEAKRLEMEMEKMRIDTALKLRELQLKEAKEAANIEAAQAQAQAAVLSRDANAGVHSAVQTLAQMMEAQAARQEAAMQHLGRAKKIVRDKAGRVVGIE